MAFDPPAYLAVAVIGVILALIVGGLSIKPIGWKGARTRVMGIAAIFVAAAAILFALSSDAPSTSEPIGNKLVEEIGEVLGE